MDAQLVLEATRRDGRCARARRAVLARPGAWAPGTARCPCTPSGASGSAGQHEVDDVVGDVVVAPGDEDLLAGEPVAAVAVRHGARAHRRQVRAGLRLGQVHGAGPFAADQLRQVERLLAVGAVGLAAPRSRRRSASGTARRPCWPRSPSRTPPAPRPRAGPGRRTPDRRRGRSSRPRRTGDRRRRSRRACAPGRSPSARALLIAGPVERGQHWPSQLAGLLEHGIDELRCRLLEPGQGLQPPEPGQLVHHEAHVAHRCKISRHRRLRSVSARVLGFSHGAAVKRGRARGRNRGCGRAPVGNDPWWRWASRDPRGAPAPAGTRARNPLRKRIRKEAIVNARRRPTLT